MEKVTVSELDERALVQEFTDLESFVSVMNVFQVDILFGVCHQIDARVCDTHVNVGEVLGASWHIGRHNCEAILTAGRNDGRRSNCVVARKEDILLAEGVLREAGCLGVNVSDTTRVLGMGFIEVVGRIVTVIGTAAATAASCSPTTAPSVGTTTAAAANAGPTLRHDRRNLERGSLWFACRGRRSI